MSSAMSVGTTSTIRVVAPATLAEDYTFDVTLGGARNKRPFTVTVPKGGVKKGQTFEIPFPNNYHDDDDDDDEEHGSASLASQESRINDKDGYDIDDQRTVPCQSKSRDDDDDDGETQADDETGAPRGQWRHSLWTCCDVLTQATFWTALVLPPVMLAQLVTRLGLNYRGVVLLKSSSTPGSSSHTVFAEATEEANLSYNKIILSFVAVLCLGNLLPGVGLALVAAYVMVLTAFVGSNIRRSMRRRYRIPPTLVCAVPCCSNTAKHHGRWSRSAKPGASQPNTGSTERSSSSDGGYVEDCLCLTFCSCCTLIQMARHTHNDKEYPGFCCTTTGLEVAAPQIV